MTQNAYRKQVIEPIKDSQDAWIRLGLSTAAHFPRYEFVFDDLGFILGTPHADLYAELLHQQKRYDLAIDLIIMRSKAMLEELSPKMEALGYQYGQTLDLERLERDVGPTLIGKIKMLTERIIVEIDENLTSSWDLYARFRAAMLAQFKGMKLVTLSKETKPTAGPPPGRPDQSVESGSSI